MTARHCDWVTDGERVGVVVQSEVLWLGGGVSPLSDALRVLSPEEADRALELANEATPRHGADK